MRAATFSFLIIVALAMPSRAFADEPQTPERHLFARALFGASAGDVDYGLKGMVTGITVESELDWPASFLLAGVEVGARGHLSTRRWEASLTFLGSLTGTFGEITDQDWFGGPTIPRTEVSHTDSPTVGTALVFDLAARLEMVSLSRAQRPVAIDLVAGYRHEYYDLDAWGAHGWQMRSPTERVDLTLPDSFHGSHYQVRLDVPSVGIGLRADLGRASIDADVLALLALSSDTDDHVERHKLGTADGIGAGVSVALRPRVQLTAPRSRVGVALGLDLRLRYLTTAGTLHQRYYGDDPAFMATAETPIPDTDYFFRSLLGVGLFTLDVSI